MYLLEAEVYFVDEGQTKTYKVYAHTLDEAKSMNISELVKKTGSELNTGSSDAVVFCVVTLNGEYIDSDEYFVAYEASEKLSA